MLELQAYAFDSEPDTEVCDGPAPITPIRGRVPTAELAVHVFHNGCRHRRTPDLLFTSCGDTFNAQFTPVLREELCLPMCTDGCFTQFELDRAAMRAAKEQDK